MSQTKVNIDNFHIGTRWDQWKWHLKRRHLLSYLINRHQWYYYPKRRKIPEFPLHVDFEASSLCNMKCPMCYRQKSDYSDYGLMDFDLFKKGIDECDKHNLYSIRLSWRGECSTNPRLGDMIKYAKDKGVKEVSLISNGYRVPMSDLIAVGLDVITISVDDLYSEYDKVRYPAIFQGIVGSLFWLRTVRDSYGKGYPQIRINGVWNEGKGQDWFQKMYEYFSPMVDYITFTPEYSHDGSEKELRPGFVCQYPYQRLTIMWNGKIPLCIADKKGEHIIGDLNKDSIYDVWHGMPKTLQPVCRRCDRAVTEQIGDKKI